jgi:glycosyltransferase involved in cell wall biosynthesis
MKARVLMIGGYDRSLVRFRGSLLQTLAAAGHSVFAAAPVETPGVEAELRALGATFVPAGLQRTGVNPLADLRSTWGLIRLMRRISPDVLIAYTIKPVALGGVAAAACNVQRPFALITGLGSAYFTAGSRGHVMRFAADLYYSTTLRSYATVFVQNEDIARELIARELVPADAIVIVPGSGVDVAHFAPEPPRPADEPMEFLYLGRMLKDKGVRELVAAAGEVKRRAPRARIVLVGDRDRNHTSVSDEEIAGWRSEGHVEFAPAVDDVRPSLRRCHALVLPSYHEGLPRVALEAMACRRPVITTDTIGCREVIRGLQPPDRNGVRWGVNGALVPVRNHRALAAAMLHLVANPVLAETLGAAGRVIAEREYDVHRVNRLMLRHMGLGDDRPARATRRAI